MAVILVDADFSVALALKGERTWHASDKVIIISSLYGVFPGLQTGTVCIIAARPTLRASRGRSARNTSGGTRLTIMAMEQRGAGSGMIFLTFLKPSPQTPKPIQMAMGWMPIRALIHLPCIAKGKAGSMLPAD